jgi:uncharacterized SAM-binding protein YcdF (DUF218 family)
MTSTYPVSVVIYMFRIMALISLAFLAVSVCKDHRRFRNAVYLQTFIISGTIALLSYLTGSGVYQAAYLIALFIVLFLLFVVPILLIINGFVVVKREGFSLSNIIALLFGILIIVGEFASLYSLSGVGPSENKLYFTAVLLFAVFVFYVSMVFLAFMFYSFFIRLIPRKAKYDYVAVLGAGLIDGEKVTKLLSERIDKAVKIYRRSDGKCRLIMSGGQGPDEKISEAQAMKNYALTLGVNEDDILLEDQSVNTMENLINCRKIIEAQPGGHDTAVVTSQYHVLRADVYARKMNFPMTGIGAHTALYYWPAAMTREYAGLVKYYWKTYLFFYLLFAVPLAATLYL